jgi:hypothetical protein
MAVQSLIEASQHRDWSPIDTLALGGHRSRLLALKGELGRSRVVAFYVPGKGWSAFASDGPVQVAFDEFTHFREIV